MFIICMQEEQMSPLCSGCFGWSAHRSSFYSSLSCSYTSYSCFLHINYWTNWLIFSILSPSVIWMNDSSVFFLFCLASLKLVVLQLWLCAVSLKPAALWIRAGSNSIYPYKKRNIKVIIYLQEFAEGLRGFNTSRQFRILGFLAFFCIVYVVKSYSSEYQEINYKMCFQILFDTGLLRIPKTIHVSDALLSSTVFPTATHHFCPCFTVYT